MLVLSTKSACTVFRVETLNHIDTNSSRNYSTGTCTSGRSNVRTYVVLRRVADCVLASNGDRRLSMLCT